MSRPDTMFDATFTNEETGEIKTFEFTLTEYIQARQWMAYPEQPPAASLLSIWLIANNLNRQSAYCAIKVWKDEMNAKGAP